MTHEVCNNINANPTVQTKVLCQNGHCATAGQGPTATLDRSVLPSVAVTDALIAPTNGKERSIDEDIAPPVELPRTNANATLAKAHHSENVSTPSTSSTSAQMAHAVSNKLAALNPGANFNSSEKQAVDADHITETAQAPFIARSETSQLYSTHFKDMCPGGGQDCSWTRLQHSS